MTQIKIGNDKKSVMTKIEIGYVSYVKKISHDQNKNLR